MDEFDKKQRQKKHKQIMSLIHNFKRTPEQIKNLQKVKTNTIMQINLRYLKSNHNRDYKFPLYDTSDSSDQQFPRGTVVYDLNCQAEVIRKSISTKVLSLDSSRRVKSLERGQWDKKRINKFKPKVLDVSHKPPEINQYIYRKNSMTDRKQNLSTIKLPQLKKIQNVRRAQIQEVIGKKMMTEESPQSKKFSKYLKNVQKNIKVKKFFLKQIP